MDDIRVPPSAKTLFADVVEEQELGRRLTARELSTRNDEYIKAMTEAVAKGIEGETVFANRHDSGAPMIGHTSGRDENVTKALEELYETSRMVKSADSVMLKGLGANKAQVETLSKEWSLTNPLSTGLVPYDLEAPAKLLTPRPTPLRNSIPRLKGQGGARRFKVISSFTGTGTGSPTIQPGVNETTGNAGPGGLSYIRPPYINYTGYDVALNYVSWGLSDSVSWQAEYQGQGYEDIRSLSNTALLYSTMLLDERLICYGRGTTANGYQGTLGVVPTFTLSAVSASIAPGGTSSLGTSASVFVIVAPDAGDLLGTNGTTMHQGPASNVVTSVGTSTGLTAVQVTITNDSSQVGALGYNLFAASVAGGPYYYAGRTGYNVGYITAQPSAGPTITNGAADSSAVSTNFDGLLTNVAASGGYVARLNAGFSSTNPGSEFQTLFASLYESVKADPDQILMNGFDRLQLSNTLFGSGTSPNSFRVYINDSEVGNVKAGAVVQSLMNEVTGTEVPITVHPWFPQGNALARSTTLPIPDSNVAETSVMVLVQDYVNVQWPVQQFTYDSSTFQIGTMCHYAPAWSGLLQGIQGVGIGVKPPGPYGDA